MSPTSAGGGTNTKTGGEHISRLVETPRGLWQNWNNGVIKKEPCGSFFDVNYDFCSSAPGPSLAIATLLSAKVRMWFSI